MKPLMVWLVLAVVVAAVVLVAASAANREGEGFRVFLRDLRAGLSARFGRRREQTPANVLAAVEAEPVDTTLEDFFAATQVDDEAYLQAEALTQTLQHAKDRVVGGVQSLTGR